MLYSPAAFLPERSNVPVHPPSVKQDFYHIMPDKRSHFHGQPVTHFHGQPVTHTSIFPKDLGRQYQGYPACNHQLAPES